MKIRHVYQSFFPLLFVSVLLGTTTIFPYVIKGKWFIANNAKLKTVHFAWFFLMNVCLLYSAYVNEDESPYYTGLSGFVMKMAKWSVISQCYIMHLFALIYTNQLKTILEDISLCDNMMSKLGMTLSYEVTFFVQMFQVFISILYLFSNITMALYSEIAYKISTIPTTLFVFFYSSSTFLSFGIRSGMLMAAILKRYWIINRELNALAVCSMQKDPQTSAVKIENINMIYVHLNNILEKINKASQVLYLTLSSVVFTMMICFLYNAYFEYYIKNNSFTAFNWFLWEVLTWIGFLYICYICHFTLNEAKRVGVTLHKLLLEDLCPHLLGKMCLFSNHVMNAQLECSACGFFQVDGSLVYLDFERDLNHSIVSSVNSNLNTKKRLPSNSPHCSLNCGINLKKELNFVGATFTYMIVMLQFKEGSE